VHIVNIGRKIYYELTTGNVILDTGERQGDVVETTEDQDWQMYAALQPYQRSAVGVLQLEFGQYAENFAKYPYHVDVSQSPPVIAWDVDHPFGATLEDIKNVKIAQLRDFFQQTLNAGFQSSADGTPRTYGFSPTDQANMSHAANVIALGIAVYPIPYADITGAVVELNEAQFKQLVIDAQNFNLTQVNKLRSLIAQVKQATTVDEVNAVQW
jgi:hypothetical protein